MKVHAVVDAMRDARRARGWSPADLARESGAAHENTIRAWETGQRSPRIDQIAPVLATLGLSLAAAEPVLSLPEGRPHARIEPAVRFGAAHIRGISCEAIAGLTSVEGVEQAMQDYSLRREDVLVACWHQGRYGGRRWRFWHQWAETAGDEMWSSAADFSAIPDPPDRPAGPATNRTQGVSK